MKYLGKILPANSGYSQLITEVLSVSIYQITKPTIPNLNLLLSKINLNDNIKNKIVTQANV